ncbi:MAG: ATP-binding protein, partial [Verrucomicrobiota bacterium]
LQRSVGLNLENRIPPDVSSRVVGEQTRLVRIIENILSHSLRNSQEGTSISVRITSVNDWIRTEIHEVVPSIKRSGDDPFEALLTADRSGRKASLALYFCKLTVERWGGEVGYEPDPKSPHWWFNLPQANATSS